MFKSSVLILILSASVIHCQFFYNYEEDVPEDSQAEPQYNPSQQLQPTSANEPYNQPTHQTDNPPRSRHTRTQVRIRSSNYPPLTDSVDSQSPDVDARTLRQERRQEKRRQRQRMSDYDARPYQPPRVYGPSVFERIGLGEPPAGVFVPQDSLLNVLRNTGSSFQPSVPQTRSFVPPAESYMVEPQQSFFGQPPSTMDDSGQMSSALSVPRHQAAVPTPSRPQLQGRSVDSGRRSRSQRRRTQPVVDIDSYREHTDDIRREEIRIVPKVEYIPASNRDILPTQRSRIVPVEPPRSPIYSRSVFENVPLGEAPSSVYIPEDSLLNAIRNPSVQRSVAPQAVQYSPRQTDYNAPQETMLEPGMDEEEEYQYPAPVSSPPRRQSHTRTRPLQRQSYSVSQENAPVPQRQRSSQRQRNDYAAEDFQRRPRQQQSQRKQQSVADATRSQTQASSQAKPFREARLAQAELPMDSDDDGIPGEAGTDYPTLHVIPKTSFSCSQQPHKGYYADLETSCQVVHMCQAGGVKSSYLCPNGTIFNQEKFSCQWWYEVNCNNAPQYYAKNNELYKVPEKKDRKRN